MRVVLPTFINIVIKNQKAIKENANVLAEM